ncbi:MAG: non-heme iron oxygenase ferredoxin subunit [Planctomycetota bacterium]|nr:MAG: non-heme iron oxygenase ferredoxin subunit [Planctomycetota bacterium]
MSQWIRVLDLEDLKEDIHVFVFEGEKIAIIRKGEKEFYAIQDKCSHATAFLSEGEVEGYEIICPRHGARFDIRTGKNLCLPAVVPVKSYPVKIEDGALWIEWSNED